MWYGGGTVQFSWRMSLWESQEDAAAHSHLEYVHALPCTLVLAFLEECYGWDTTKQYAYSLESRGARFRASHGTTGTIDAEADTESELLAAMLAAMEAK